MRSRIAPIVGAFALGTASLALAAPSPDSGTTATGTKVGTANQAKMPAGSTTSGAGSTVKKGSGKHTAKHGTKGGSTSMSGATSTGTDATTGRTGGR